MGNPIFHRSCIVCDGFLVFRSATVWTLWGLTGVGCMCEQSGRVRFCHAEDEGSPPLNLLLTIAGRGHCPKGPGVSEETPKITSNAGSKWGRSPRTCATGRGCLPTLSRQRTKWDIGISPPGLSPVLFDPHFRDQLNRSVTRAMPTKVPYSHSIGVALPNGDVH